MTNQSGTCGWMAPWLYQLKLFNLKVGAWALRVFVSSSATFYRRREASILGWWYQQSNQTEETQHTVDEQGYFSDRQYGERVRAFQFIKSMMNMVWSEDKAKFGPHICMFKKGVLRDEVKRNCFEIYLVLLVIFSLQKRSEKLNLLIWKTYLH